MANEIRRFMVKVRDLWFGDKAYLFDGVYLRNVNLEYGHKRKRWYVQ